MKLIFTSLITLAIFQLQAQSIDRQQFSSYSATLTTDNNSIQFIIGEINIMSMEGGETSLSGLLQLDDDVEILTGLNTDLLSLGKIYPNPTADYIHMDLNDYRDLRYSVYSVKGEAIMEETPITSATEVIDISAIAQGNYLLVIRSIKINQYQVLEFIKY